MADLSPAGFRKKQTGTQRPVIFWFGVIWSIFWGVIIGFWVGERYTGVLTFDQINETIWSVYGFLFFMYAFAIPLGAIFVGMGALHYVGIRGVKLCLVGASMVLTILLGTIISVLWHIPWLFGLGGSLLLFSFLGVAWYWAKERKTLDEVEVAVLAADLKLIGYVFMMISAWFTCGITSQQHVKALSGQPPTSPMNIMLPLLLGWLFLFLGHYKAAKSHSCHR